MSCITIHVHTLASYVRSKWQARPFLLGTRAQPSAQRNMTTMAPRPRDEEWRGNSAHDGKLFIRPYYLRTNKCRPCLYDFGLVRAGLHFMQPYVFVPDLLHNADFTCCIAFELTLNWHRGIFLYCLACPLIIMFALFVRPTQL